MPASPMIILCVCGGRHRCRPYNVDNDHALTEFMATETKRISWRWLRRIFVAIVILGVLLLADLQFKGLAWRAFWYFTGEESIAGQIRGMVEVSGNLIRPQPRLEPLVPIQHTDVSPFGINTFLQNEAEVEKRDEQLRLIREAGFDWIRQEFPWEDIEVDGRGEFTDSRNDYDGDGTPDTIDAWGKYDNIVDLADQYDIMIMARLSNPPNWAQEGDLGDFAPPADYQDFVNYAVAVAERYQGRIRYYQVWNEPNIFPEWGAQPPSPVAYTKLLCRTYDALKAVDPEIVVVSGAIAPTQSLTGYDYQDLVYLQNMYEAGAKECFDVLSAQGYGLNSGPTDKRLRFNYFSFARHILYRDLMVAYSDENKAIWLSEVSWNHGLDATRPPEEITGYAQYGLTTQEQAARYTPIGYQRSREAWSWIGKMSFWYFTVHSNQLDYEARYYFRMVEPDYSAEKPTFTPLPIYYAMQDYITEAKRNAKLYRGVHQAQSWEVGHNLSDDKTLVTAEGAQFDDAMQGNDFFFYADGTRVDVRVKTDTPIRLIMDGTFDIGTIESSDDWQTVTIDSRFLAEEHSYILDAESAFLLDSITIDDTTWRNYAIIAIVGVLLGLVVMGGVIWVWRRSN